MLNITPLDDFPIHQTSDTLSIPSTSDRNFYDRYWFNGFSPDKDFLFEIGIGVYPNRHIIDAHFSIATNNKQFSFHASKRLNPSRYPIEVGPITLEIVEPMSVIRFILDDPDNKLSCDITFNAITSPHLEPKSTMQEGSRVLMDTSRFTQFGKWSGKIITELNEITLKSEYGTRDKSWGVRPVGEPEAGAPGKLAGEPGVYWCWIPINFDDCFTHFGTFQDHDGNPTQLSADIVTISNSKEIIEPINNVEHSVKWIKGTRWSESATIEGYRNSGENLTIQIDTVGPRFHCKGIGYQHPEWGHAFWKGEMETGYEVWDLDKLDPNDFTLFHTHQIAHAKMGSKEGFGTLENLVIGRHDPSGFKELFDVAK